MKKILVYALIGAFIFLMLGGLDLLGMAFTMWCTRSGS